MRGAELVHRVHRPRIVDVVGRDERRVERAGTRRVEQLVEEAAAGWRSPCQLKMRSTQKYWAPTFELRFSHRGFSGSAGGFDRVRSDVAEPARHADPVRLHEIAREVVGRVAVVALRIPLPPRLLVEVGIGEQPQADDRRWARRSTSRPARSCRERRSARPGISTRWQTDRGGQLGSRTSSQRPYRLGSGAVAFREARLVHQAEVVRKRLSRPYCIDGCDEIVLRKSRRADADRGRSRPRSDRCRRSRRATCCGPDLLARSARTPPSMSWK